MKLDPERVKARLGKCYHPDCDNDPDWFYFSWYRYCDEHVPEETPEKGVARKWHRFK